MKDSLAGKTIVVTGGNKGLGKELSTLFCSLRASVIIIGKDDSLNKETVREIKTQGGSIEAICADLRNPEEVKKVFTHILSRYTKVDILVNNAAVSYFEEAKDINENAAQEMLDVNLRAVYLATKAVLPAMLKNQSGTVVNISSIYGVRADKKTSLYSMTKHGLIGYSKGLHCDYREKGVKVLVFCPVAFGDTDILKTSDLARYISAAIASSKDAFNESVILKKEILGINLLMFIERLWGALSKTVRTKRYLRRSG